MQLLEVEPKELSRNEQLLLREENTRLRFLLDHKDKLLEELTSKIVDYQHADLDRQRLCMKKLGEARQQTKKARKEQSKKTKKQNLVESLNWFRASLAEQIGGMKTQYESSLQIMEKKYEEDLRELEQKYELLLKVKLEQVELVQQQLRETVMANRRKEETWLSGEAKWREKELEYQDLMRRSEKGIKRLENQVMFVQKERDRIQSQLQIVSSHLTECKQSLRTSQEQHDEQIKQLKKQHEDACRVNEERLAEAQAAYKALEQSATAREKALEQLVRKRSQQKPLEISQPTKCQTTELSSRFQKIIDELTLSNDLKDKQIEVLKRKVEKYRKEIRMEESSEQRIRTVNQAGGTVRSLYEDFKRGVKAKLPRS